jgi:hypothetical protein
MSRRFCFCVVSSVAALLSALISPVLAAGQESPVANPSAADLLPRTIALYAEAPAPAATIDILFDHPLRGQVESLDQVKAALESPQFQQAQALVSAWEAHMGADYRTSLKAVVGGGVAIAYDKATQGTIVLIKADSDETATKTRDFFLGLARMQGAGKSDSNPLKETEYRGATAHEFQNGMLVVVGPWIAVTNKNDLAKGFVDRFADWKSNPVAPENRLSGSANFQAAQAANASSLTAWGFADLQVVREAGAAKELFAGKSPDNPVGELLVGGILGALADSPYAGASLDAASDKLSLSLTIPHDVSAIKPEREYFFGPGVEGKAPALASVQNQVLSLSAYRDAAGMWLHAGDLFDENTNDQFALADSQLTTLFAGKDFGEDILGALGPGVQIVASRQDFTGATVTPAIKLPQFAAVFTLKEPETMRDELRRIFQSLVGFLNVVGAMNGQPQLDVDIERSDELQVAAATYVATEDEKKSGEGRINFNFSPTAAFLGDKFILASTEALARELAASESVTAAQATSLNTAMVGDGAVLKSLLEDNRAQLVAQNMLEEGRTQEEAEKAIGGLLAIVEAIRSASIELQATAGKLQLDAQVEMNVKQ